MTDKSNSKEVTDILEIFEQQNSVPIIHMISVILGGMDKRLDSLEERIKELEVNQ